jgi:two-component system, cell cycle sensor histidine kinase and response regulator CckA
MNKSTRLAQRQAQAYQNDQLTLTLQSIGDGIITTDAVERITFLNAAAERLTGWSTTDALGKSLTDVFHIINRKTRQVAADPAARVLQEGQVIGLAADTALVAHDGTEQIISSSVAPIRDQAGTITGVVLVFRDVTRLRRAEEALKESQDYNRSLIDSSLDMIIAVDQNRHIIEFNRAAQETFGYTSEEILGKDVNVLYGEPQDGTRIHNAIAEHGRHAQEVINRRKNGEVFPALLSASQLKNAQGDVIGVMGVSRDITQLKHATEQQIKAERFAALGRMAAALAHEINNPLQAISSTMDLVLNYPLEANEREENLKIISQEIERLGIVAGRVLQFARPATAPRRLVAIEKLIDDTVRLAEKQMQHAHVRLTTEIESLPLITASPDQLIQVFLNLTLNAVEAMEHGGELKIKACVAAESILIEFINDGPSIPAKILPRIFEPFYTTKKDGSGLGLSVSQTIIEQHGGIIRAENLGADQGTRFSVQLSLLPAED